MEKKDPITDQERTHIRLSILKMKQWDSQQAKVLLARRIEELESKEDRELYLETAAYARFPNLEFAEADFQWVKGIFNPKIDQ